MSKNVSLKEIASKVGVSVNTVSHALRDLPDISEGLKRKIRKIALEMGYMPNHVAQTMKIEEKPLVAVHISSFNNVYVNAFYQELTRVFSEKDDYSLTFVFSTKDPVEVVKQCILIRADYLISVNYFDEKADEMAKLNNLHILHTGGEFNPQKGEDYVFADNDVGCRLVARYLYGREKTGKYIYIGIPDYPDESLNIYNNVRREIFEDELKKLDEKAEILQFRADDGNIDKICSLIIGGCRNFFCFNDLEAYSLLRLLENRLGDIEKLFPDIEIVGFDGLCISVVGMRDITTVAVDYGKFSEQIYSVVKNRFENPSMDAQFVAVPVFMHYKKNKAIY